MLLDILYMYVYMYYICTCIYVQYSTWTKYFKLNLLKKINRSSKGYYQREIQIDATKLSIDIYESWKLYFSLQIGI